MSAFYRDADGYMRLVDTKRLITAEQIRVAREALEKVTDDACDEGHDFTAQVALDLMDSVEVTT